MLFTRLYYQIKRFIPWRLSLAIRQSYSRRILRTCQDFWPIQESAGRKPPGWPGWPGGKRFALVLTHDVEGERGLDRVKQLAELETKSGFRSSFNLVPEGMYAVAPALRAWLTNHGFEVGVHDLCHDGRLYSSWKSFRRNAQRINNYLAQWNAVGFRSAFMLRNMRWLRELNLLYDASTFDTDPFEPQPEGAGTIFPFWVGHGDGRGYVELPYTLVQDSTLFLVLREGSIDIWKRKLDWIVQQGGMALLITHPDYMEFGGLKNKGTYPASLYQEFLSYVATRYQDQFWNALPSGVATFFNESYAKMRRPVAPKRVCMITHSHYESDNRVIRYAEALAQRGDTVEVLALRRNPGMSKKEVISGVTVIRIQDRFARKEKSEASFLWPILRFWTKASFSLTRRHMTRRYDFVHVHNIPDFLVFAAWYPKLTGVKLVLDIHDLVPEFFASKFGSSGNSKVVWALRLMEKISAAFADHIIVANHLWLEKYVSRSASREKCSALINHVDSSIFRPQPRRKDNGHPVVLFPGALEWHQGLDIALRAFARLRLRMSDAEFHIYGDGMMKSELVELAAQLGLNGSVHFFEPLRIREIAEVMARADLGIVPKRANSFGNEAHSTKIMEFMSVGVPVVASNTKIERYYLNDSMVRFFESDNVDALADAMYLVLSDPELRRKMINNASEFVTLNSWETRKADYFELVDSLCAQNPTQTRSAH
jgi:glycosyltransferase involved in cell wall biosynthesis